MLCSTLSLVVLTLTWTSFSYPLCDTLPTGPTRTQKGTCKTQRLRMTTARQIHTNHPIHPTHPSLHLHPSPPPPPASLLTLKPLTPPNPFPTTHAYQPVPVYPAPQTGKRLSQLPSHNGPTFPHTRHSSTHPALPFPRSHPNLRHKALSPLHAPFKTASPVSPWFRDRDLERPGGRAREEGKKKRRARGSGSVEGKSSSSYGWRRCGSPWVCTYTLHAMREARSGFFVAGETGLRGGREPKGGGSVRRTGVVRTYVCVVNRGGEMRSWCCGVRATPSSTYQVDRGV